MYAYIADDGEIILLGYDKAIALMICDQVNKRLTEVPVILEFPKSKKFLSEINKYIKLTYN